MQTLVRIDINKSEEACHHNLLSPEGTAIHCEGHCLLLSPVKRQAELLSPHDPHVELPKGTIRSCAHRTEGEKVKRRKAKFSFTEAFIFIL